MTNEITSDEIKVACVAQDAEDYARADGSTVREQTAGMLADSGQPDVVWRQELERVMERHGRGLALLKTHRLAVGHRTIAPDWSDASCWWRPSGFVSTTQAYRRCTLEVR